MSVGVCLKGARKTVLAAAALVDLFVDLRDFANPDLPFLVFHVEYVVYRPVKMISDIRYLLIQLIQGVA